MQTCTFKLKIITLFESIGPWQPHPAVNEFTCLYLTSLVHRGGHLQLFTIKWTVYSVLGCLMKWQGVLAVSLGTATHYYFSSTAHRVINVHTCSCFLPSPGPTLHCWNMNDSLRGHRACFYKLPFLSWHSLIYMSSAEMDTTDTMNVHLCKIVLMRLHDYITFGTKRLYKRKSDIVQGLCVCMYVHMHAHTQE